MWTLFTDASSFVRSIGTGTWPDWVGTIVTSLAFIVAAGSFKNSVKWRREAQARLVYSRVENTSHYAPQDLFDPLPNDAQIGNGATGVELLNVGLPGQRTQYRALVPVMQISVLIRNGSQELIGPVKVQVVNLGKKQVYDCTSVSFAPLNPDSDMRVSFVIPNVDYPGQPSLGSTVLFRDASGRWWRRHHIEPIESVHADPENSAPTPRDRALYGKVASANGYQPKPKPRPTLGVLCHRWMRKMRGKHQIP